MARLDIDLPTDLIKELETLEKNTDDMCAEMLEESAKYTYNLIKANMKKVFKTTKSLEKGLKITKVYRTPTDDAVNIHIDFYGYVPNSPKTERHPQGTPISLIAYAREYGTSRGEKDRPFMKASFKKKEILNIMEKIEKKYTKGE